MSKEEFKGVRLPCKVYTTVLIDDRFKVKKSDKGLKSKKDFLRCYDNNTMKVLAFVFNKVNPLKCEGISLKRDNAREGNFFQNKEEVIKLELVEASSVVSDETHYKRRVVYKIEHKFDSIEYKRTVTVDITGKDKESLDRSKNQLDKEYLTLQLTHGIENYAGKNPAGMRRLRDPDANITRNLIDISYVDKNIVYTIMSQQGIIGKMKVTLRESDKEEVRELNDISFLGIKEVEYDELFHAVYFNWTKKSSVPYVPFRDMSGDFANPNLERYMGGWPDKSISPSHDAFAFMEADFVDWALVVPQDSYVRIWINNSQTRIPAGRYVLKRTKYNILGNNLFDLTADVINTLIIRRSNKFIVKGGRKIGDRRTIDDSVDTTFVSRRRRLR